MPQRSSLVSTLVDTIRVVILIALLTVLCDGRKRNCKERRKSATNRIIDGYEITPGEFPEFVAVRIVEKHYRKGQFRTCSGVIIGEDMVLTAAHCVQTWHEMEIGMGVYTPDAWPYIVHGVTKHKVIKACPSEQYYLDEVGRAFYDFAILVLEKPIKNATIAPLEMNPIEPGWKGTAVGAGLTEHHGNGRGETPFASQALPMESVECYEKNRHETHVCFTNYNPKYPGDVCYGDSGGPVLSDGPIRTVLALASYENEGEICLHGGKARTVFANIPNLRHQIEQTIIECRP